MASKKHKVINVTGDAVSFSIAGSGPFETEDYTLQPQEIVEIASSYAVPQKVGAGDPRPSVISQLTNNRVLAVDDPRAKHLVPVPTATATAAAVPVKPANKQDAAKQDRA